MARVPYVEREQLAPEQQQHYDAIAGSRGRVGPNFQTLLNSPEAGGRFASFGEYVRFHGDVPARLKELAIITAAREANNDYVWTAHERLAREQGVTDPIISAIRNRTAPDGLTGDDAAVVRFAKELLTRHEIGDTTFNAMHQMLGNKGIMDLILLILYYHSLAHALQAVKLEMPPGTPSTL
ncbi:MAG TPA: carboxymuconolactone decarboxylase family protein [Candidatus Tectomicrobia bacterium]